MRINRNEFKELAAKYNDIYKTVKKIESIDVDESKEIDDVVNKSFELLNWATEELGISEDFFEYITNLLSDLYVNGQIPVRWDYDTKGEWCNVVYSDDLDKIYDMYFISDRYVDVETTFYWKNWDDELEIVNIEYYNDDRTRAYVKRFDGCVIGIPVEDLIVVTDIEEKFMNNKENI